MEMVKGDYICEGKTDVKCHLPLPTEPHIRKWLLARITAETVQAIGRARGANSEKVIDVHIYGGVPLHGLGQHGLSVDSYEQDPACLGTTKAEHMDEMHGMREDSLARCDVLAARIIAKGGTVTRDAMQEEVDELNAIDAANALWMKHRAETMMTNPICTMWPSASWILKRQTERAKNLMTRIRTGVVYIYILPRYE